MSNIFGNLKEPFSLAFMKSKAAFDWNRAHLKNVKLDLNENDFSQMNWNSASWEFVDVSNYVPSTTNAYGHLDIKIMAGMSGQMKDCGVFNDYDKNHYTCQDGVFLGPKASLQDVDCSNLVLNKMPYRLTGICGCKWENREHEEKPKDCPNDERTCPAPYNMPVSLETSGSEPFISTCVNGIIFHPMMRHTNLDMTNLKIQGIDARGLDWSTNTLKHVYGRLESCPLLLPAQYSCTNNYIVGPFVNLQGADLFGVELHTRPVEDFEGIHGTLYECPKTLPKGIRCIWDLTGFRFVGIGIQTENLLLPFIEQVNSPRARQRQELSPNSNFMEDSNSTISFKNARITGIGCPRMMPFGYACKTQEKTSLSYVVGPYSDITLFDFEGIDLSDVDLRGVHGIILNCPSKLPTKWFCASKSELSLYQLFGPDSYYKELDISWLHTNESWTLRGSKVKSVINRFKNGLCPEKWRLPHTYECENGYLYGENAMLYEHSKDIHPDSLTNMKVVINKNNAFKETLTMADHGNCNQMNKLFWKTCPNYIKKIVGEEKDNNNLDSDSNSFSSHTNRRVLHSVIKRSKHPKQYMHPSLFQKPKVDKYKEIDISAITNKYS
tara:strand:- start:7676 stop:9499 length:1824 start_codon:yes stop_codon:yes gene_type:complete